MAKLGSYSRDFRSGRTLRIGGDTPDTPEQVAERVRRREAGDQAHAEMLARFRPLSESNAIEAIRWQEARMRELMARDDGDDEEQRDCDGEEDDALENDVDKWGPDNYGDR